MRVGACARHGEVELCAASLEIMSAVGAQVDDAEVDGRAPELQLRHAGMLRGADGLEAERELPTHQLRLLCPLEAKTVGGHLLLTTLQPAQRVQRVRVLSPARVPRVWVTSGTEGAPVDARGARTGVAGLGVAYSATGPDSHPAEGIRGATAHEQEKHQMERRTTMTFHPSAHDNRASAR